MKTIPLTKGYLALDGDYELLVGFNWYAQVTPRTVYAQRIKRVAGKRETIAMHRFIVGCEKRVDHQDSNGLNNQRYNLRPVTVSQNGGNARKPKRTNGSSSRFKGVSRKKATGKWGTCITSNGIPQHLGYFRDEVDAATAYNFAAEELFGDFALFNTPLGPL